MQLGPGTRPPPKINHRREDVLGGNTQPETPSAIHMPAVWVKGLRASVAAITPSASDDALAELTASARCAAAGAGGAAYTLPIEATVNGTFVQALGDTGANVSLIDAEVAASLQLKGVPCTVKAASAGSGSFEALERATTIVRFGGLDFPVDLLVVRNLGHDLILGTDVLAHSGRSSHWYWTGTGEVTIDFDGGVPFTAKTTRATRQAGEDVAVIRVTDTKSLIVEGWFGDGDELSVEEVAEAVVTAASVPDLRAQRPALERDRADSRQDDRDAWRRVKIDPSLSRRAQKRLRQVLHQHWRAFTLRSVPPLMKGVCHRITLRDDADPESAVEQARRFSPGELQAIREKVTDVAASKRSQ